MKQTLAYLAVAFLFAFVSCSMPSTEGAKLTITNDLEYPIVLRFGSWDSQPRFLTTTPSIPAGGTYTFFGAPLGEEFNIWFEYSAEGIDWVVRLIDYPVYETAVFNFVDGGIYRLIVEKDVFEFYDDTPLPEEVIPGVWIEGLGMVSAIVRTSGSTFYAIDRDASVLYRLDGTAETVEVAATLPNASPIDLEFSPEEGLLYVCYSESGEISRYSPATGSFLDPFDFSTSSETDHSFSLEISDANDRIYVMVKIRDMSPSIYHDLAIVNLKTGELLKQATLKIVLTPPLIALSPEGSKLYYGDWHLSIYDTGGDSPSFLKAVDSSYNDTRDLICTSDGLSIVNLSTGGNLDMPPGYWIADYSPADLSIRGGWNVAARGIVFSGDSKFLYAMTNAETGRFEGNIQIFSKATYEKIRDIFVPRYEQNEVVMEVSADNSCLVVFTIDTDRANPRFNFYKDIR